VNPEPCTCRPPPCAPASLQAAPFKWLVRSYDRCYQETRRTASRDKGLQPKPWILNPRHSIRNPQPYTLNPGHSIRNPQPYTLNPGPSTSKSHPCVRLSIHRTECHGNYSQTASVARDGHLVLPAC